ncbi:MAG: AtpZ/AtpI family protein [Balneolaceae bacterium]
MPENPKSGKYLEYISLGGEIAVAFSAPMLLGYWADSTFGTSPWALLSGIFIGVILMLAIFARVIRGMNKPE